ncbi:DUF4136 domain-containing protein [Winogradskyella sp. UBA3174]|uniref:DUF4136 domain-containing protein n=1 Tax=Winogradskyella sp. UBA3174 TaxID=1947785 RepID=UPI0025CE8A1C|nr:DUF4136 domain-containing protein [Winogradskyella sp. UBA3174]|tara:strand:- start:36580 stop:37098 length:519 start_codon:yes stop_codon:yes gene_type:complete
MKAFKYILVAFMLTSCGTVVNFDYEKSTDFTQYKTYKYFDDMKTGLSELDSKRLIKAIDDKLKTMGMMRSDNANFYIDIQSQDIQNQNNSNVGIGAGGGGGGSFGGVSVGFPLGGNQNTRELVIEFLKTNRTSVFWQAVSKSSYKPNATPEKREEILKALVEKIFAGYPPKK